MSSKTARHLSVPFRCFSMMSTNPKILTLQGRTTHVADEVRYFCMSRPISARQVAAQDDFINNPLHVYLDIKKEDLTHADRPFMEVITL